MAVRFNGTNDALGTTAPISVLNGLSRATIMAWCRPNGPVTGTPTVFAASIGPPPGLSGSSRFSIDRNAGGGGQITVTVRTSDGAGAFGMGAGGGNDYLSSQWQHVAAVLWLDFNVGTIYQNGNQLNGYQTLTGLLGTAFSSTDPKALAVGANEDFASGFWNGDIEDCRIYNWALSQDDINTIISGKGKDGIVSGLQVRYPLTDGPIGTAVTVSSSFVDNPDANPSVRVGPLRPLSGAPTFIDGIIAGPRSRGLQATRSSF
jgi:hypothetical protein